MFACVCVYRSLFSRISNSASPRLECEPFMSVPDRRMMSVCESHTDPPPVFIGWRNTHTHTLSRHPQARRYRVPPEERRSSCWSESRRTGTGPPPSWCGPGRTPSAHTHTHHYTLSLCAGVCSCAESLLSWRSKKTHTTWLPSFYRWTTHITYMGTRNVYRNVWVLFWTFSRLFLGFTFITICSAEMCHFS